MEFQTIRYEKRDHIAIITLDRPDHGNALNGQLHRELWAAWNDFRFDGESWVVILTGAGETFCLGEDQEEIATALEQGTVPERYREPRDGRLWGYRYEHYRRRKLNVWKPVVVAVNGPCQGTGLVLVGQGDIILAAETATFSLPEVSLGLVPAESALLLADRMPFGAVLRLALLGEQEHLEAARAHALGLVSEVMPPARLFERAWTVATTITEQAGDAVRAMATTLHARRDLGYDDALVLGYEYHERFENIENMLEGPRAFTEKRKPVWTIRPPRMG
ncbi:MAG: enoyl-CoA hydratase/isomerase family protein [Chloroflexi bacterium]|nr:enoyl-CoA hydratase/isomerase family protein [Chloroflexota bacterium]